MIYKYGMRLRPFDIGCQPPGSVKHEYTDKKDTGYWSYIWYDHGLTEKEMFDYDLELLDLEEINDD